MIREWVPLDNFPIFLQFGDPSPKNPSFLQSEQYVGIHTVIIHYRSYMSLMCTVKGMTYTPWSMIHSIMMTWWQTLSDDALLCLMMMIVPIHIVTHTMASTKEWCWYDAIYSSVVCWVPKGVAKVLPDSAELPSQEEIQELLKCNIPGESGL